jgi:hypothetical protein
MQAKACTPTKEINSKEAILKLPQSIKKKGKYEKNFIGGANSIFGCISLECDKG